MTFELSQQQQAVRDRARAFAHDHLLKHADEIDRTASIPEPLARQAAEIVASAADGVGLVAVVEELAVGSGAVAAAASTGRSTQPANRELPGLRGAGALDESPRSHLTLAAIALGVGRAALEAALRELRQAAAAAAGTVEKPHWVVADAATELEAARLATQAAAQAVDRGATPSQVGMARLLTATAARAAVDVAVRIAGRGGYREGTLLERLARDVRTLSVMLGTEEQHRAMAADGLLPE
jgi:alkylation response protein AidB-like acyl-CoA dehydrogenase